MFHSRDKNYTERLTCSKETKKRILKDCVDEYLKWHPEMKGVLITQGFILEKMVDFFLK